MSREQLTKLVGLLRERQASRPTPMLVGPMRAGMELLGSNFAPPKDCVAERVFVPTTSAEWVHAPGASAARVVLYLHGGGYVQGSPHTHRNLAYQLSKQADARVLVLDYRMAPEHPFPAAIDDAVSAWRWLLEAGCDPDHMTIAGDSAGGGLTVSTQVQLRNLGLPLPATSVCISPWVDLQGSGESIVTKADVDPMIDKSILDWFAHHYLAGANARAPLASPMYADLRGLPPMLIQVGSAEALLDDANRLAAAMAAAGSEATLRVWEDMVHVWHLFQPMLSEADEALAEAGSWINSRT